MATQVDKVLSWLAQNEGAGVDRLLEWLRIASISTDAKYAGDCKRAAEWAAGHMRQSGLEVEVLPTGPAEKPGHPVVLGHAPGSAAYRGPHVLFYGHYDVQPVDPVELWDSPPFEPVIREVAAGGVPGRRVVGRGAVDDKGQVMTFLEALRGYKEVTGAVAGGVKMTVLLEGEEESGSVHLDDFIRATKERLQVCDVCLISDTGMLGRGKPAITYGVRGLAYTQITLHGPDQDLHSGLWGGRVYNPILALTHILAQMHDGENRVTIPGFYDGVPGVDARERRAWEGLNMSAAESLAGIGLPAGADWGEKGYSAVEREWARPTAEINGIWGGYTGAGAKTVIPSHASAKVSFRLVGDQQPGRVAGLFFEWLKARTPAGFRWELTDLHGGYPATLPIDSVHMQAAGRALKRASGVDAAMIKSGGSIPVAGTLMRELGMSTIFMGFGLDDDRVHSPNEKFEIDCFRLGCRSHALFIDELLALRQAP